ncbi:MAG: DUF4149 domain-containing protein [Thermoanaerobaculia bacterium]
MRVLYLLSVWIHLLSVVTWLGSTISVALILVPALRRRGDRRLTAELMDAAGRRLRTMGWIAFALLALTGTTQLYVRGFRFADLTGTLWQGEFGRALAVKLVLFALVVALSAIHDFSLGPRAGRAAPGSAEAESLRRRASWLGRLNLVFGLLIVFFASGLVRGGP